MATTADPTTLKDSDWTRTSFLVPKGAYSTQDREHRFQSDARLKFSDTTLGGAPCINPPPQFCRYADIKISGILSGRAPAVDTPIVKAGNGYKTLGDQDPIGSRGMGRYYSEALDNTGEYVTFRFGVPKYNTLLAFMSTFYDTEMSAVARTGKGTSLFFKAARVVGFVVGMAAMPGLMVGRALMFFLGSRISRFYYLDPAMHNYWSAANNIANSLAVNMKIIPLVGGKGDSRDALEARQAEIKAYMRNLPDIFRADGGIDLYAVCNRYNRLYLKFQERVNRIADKAQGLPEFRNALVSGLFGALVDTKPRDIKQYIDEYIAVQENQLIEAELDATQSSFPANGPPDKNGNKSAVWEFSQKVMDLALSEANDGGQFITFRVDSTGPTTDSFNNTIAESSIAGKLNGMSAQARTMRFDMGQSQTGIGVVDAIKTAVTGLFSAGTAVIGIENIAAVFGNAYVEIPKVWKDSSASMNRMTYTIELRSWSGAPMARFQNIMIPLSCLLAAVLPQSTGKQSYTQPFLLEAYSKGRCQVRLGMIESMTITRGVGNLGRNMDGDPLGITVQFSVADMSSILHMPLSTGIGLMSKTLGVAASAIDGAVNMATGADSSVARTVASALDPNVYDDDTGFSDYMATLGGLSMTEQVYATQKWRINLTKQRANFESWFSVSNAMSQFSGSTPGRILSILARGTASGAPGVR